MYYVLAIITAILSGFTPVLKKNYVTNTRSVKNSGDIYLLVNIVAATIYFYILAGGNVPLNLITLIFSVIFALIGILSVLFGLVAYNYAAVVYMTVITGALGTILPFLYELIFTDVVFTTNKIISVFMRVLAISIMLFFNKGERVSKKGILICILCGIISGASGITTRMYANFPGVESDGSFFFWTNVFTLPMVFINTFRKSDFQTVKNAFKSIKPYNYFYALGSMLINNAITFISIEIIRHISGTAYSVIAGSVNILTAAFISAVIYKESVTLQTLLSVLLSIVAVVLSLL